MKLKRLVLDNFRNHKKSEIDFKEGINILVGRNAAGKTSILEAIFFLATTKSHRTSAINELINRNSKNFFIKGETEKNGSSTVLEMGFSRNGKKSIKLNHQPVLARRDIVGKLPVVFFAPEDLSLVKENPSFRRKFLDILISQMDHGYLLNLQKYQKIIYERNKALLQVREGTLGVKMLDVWDEQAVKTGVKITGKRRVIVSRLNGICSGIHNEMTGGNETISLEYCSNSNTEEEYRSKLAGKRRLEIEQGITTIGPHRDDVLIYLNGVSLRQFGSQGQQRTAALSLKLGELEVIREEVGEYPLILFDDVMSELDDRRRKFFLKIINRPDGDKGGIQSFITTTEPALFESIREDTNIIEV